MNDTMLVYTMTTTSRALKSIISFTFSIFIDDFKIISTGIVAATVGSAVVVLLLGLIVYVAKREGKK